MVGLEISKLCFVKKYSKLIHCELGTNGNGVLYFY